MTGSDQATASATPVVLSLPSSSTGPAPARTYSTRQTSDGNPPSTEPEPTPSAPAKQPFSPAGTKKSRWTDSEDAKLIELVKREPTLTWTEIAELIPGRKSSGCMMRWYNHIRKIVGDVERIEPHGSSSGLRNLLLSANQSDADSEAAATETDENHPHQQEIATAWTPEEDAALLAAVSRMNGQPSEPSPIASASANATPVEADPVMDPALEDPTFATANTGVEDAAASLNSLAGGSPAKGKAVEKDANKDAEDKVNEKAVDWDKVEVEMIQVGSLPGEKVLDKASADDIRVSSSASGPAPFKTGSTAAAARAPATGPIPVPTSTTSTSTSTFPKRTPSQYAARWTTLAAQSSAAKLRSKKRTLEILTSGAEKDYRSQGRRKAVGLRKIDILNAANSANAAGTALKKRRADQNEGQLGAETAGRSQQEQDRVGQDDMAVDENADLPVTAAANAQAAQDLATVAAAAAAASSSSTPGPVPRISVPDTLPAHPPIPFTSNSVIRGRRTAQPDELAEKLYSPGGKQMKVHLCPAENCGAAFRRSEHLKRHYRAVHEGKKPCVCLEPECGKSFSRKDNLLQHQRMVHHIDSPKLATPSLRARAAKHANKPTSAANAASTTASTSTAPSAPTPSTSATKSATQPPPQIDGQLPSVLQPVSTSTAANEPSASPSGGKGKQREIVGVPVDPELERLLQSLPAQSTRKTRAALQVQQQAEEDIVI